MIINCFITFSPSVVKHIQSFRTYHIYKNIWIELFSCVQETDFHVTVLFFFFCVQLSVVLCCLSSCRKISILRCNLPKHWVYELPISAAARAGVCVWKTLLVILTRWFTIIFIYICGEYCYHLCSLKFYNYKIVPRLLDGWWKSCILALREQFTVGGV